MILQKARLCLPVSTCLHGNLVHHGNHLHTTPPHPSRGEWERHAENAKRKVNEWFKMKGASSSYRQQTFRPPDPETPPPPSGGSGLPENFLKLFPTTAKFNSYFDRALAKFPSGMDLVRKAPSKYHPYLLLSRHDKPIGSWLLFMPSAWGICMAAQTFHLPNIPLLALFGAGAVLMRGAGCCINDMYDIDIDKRVIRTRNRPLASGKLSKDQALKWTAIQLGFSSIILFSLNTPTIVIGICSLWLVVTYPLMKRLVDYPQFYLGLTFNTGALMGYCAAAGSLAFTPFALYSAGICWTMIYDTIYAHQDKEDDKKIGVKSTALTYGDRTVEVCNNFTSAMGISLLLAGLASGMGPSYFIATFLSCSMIMRGLALVNLDDPRSCWEFFIMNRNIGMAMLIAIILGKFI